MPPKRKKTSLSADPDHVLGSGEQKPAKRQRKSEKAPDDNAFAPPKEKTAEDDDNPMKKSFTEPYTLYKTKKNGEITWTKEVPRKFVWDKKDEQMRYGGRCAPVKYVDGQDPVKVNHVPASMVDKATFKYIACKKGKLEKVGEGRFRKMTREQIAKWKTEDDGIPCECDFCVELTAIEI